PFSRPSASNSRPTVAPRLATASRSPCPGAAPAARSRRVVSTWQAPRQVTSGSWPRKRVFSCWQCSADGVGRAGGRGGGEPVVDERTGGWYRATRGSYHGFGGRGAERAGGDLGKQQHSRGPGECRRVGDWRGDGYGGDHGD